MQEQYYLSWRAAMLHSDRDYGKIGLRFLRVLMGTVIIFAAGREYAQQAGELEGLALYDAVKAFELQSKAAVSNLKRPIRHQRKGDALSVFAFWKSLALPPNRTILHAHGQRTDPALKSRY